MNRKARIIGNHAFFAIEGASYTVPSSGTVGREAKPGAADTSWIDVGVLDSVSIDPTTREEVKIHAPTPGRYRLYDVLEHSNELGVSLKCKELSALVVQALFGTLTLTTASTQYNPLEGAEIRGWLKIQQYDQLDALFNTVDVFVHLKLNGALEFGRALVEPELMGSVLHSTLNTGTLA